jgi:hypothetical protein
MLGFRLSVLMLVVGLGACFGGDASPAGGDGTGTISTMVDRAPRPDRRGKPEPEISYVPTCTRARVHRCLSGTEVQALETFDGKLYAGTTNWMETVAAIWPATSAQINVLASEDGKWRRTPSLPWSPSCARGTAPWEQVNDLHGASFSWRGTVVERLFASVLANEDGSCPGLHGTVFYLDTRQKRWVSTGLDARLGEFYGAINSEVRYVETFSDGTAACPTRRPCVFAFVGPRSGTLGPTAWRGVYSPANTRCDLICWDPEPEVVMDGIQAPSARRIVSSTSGAAGLYLGTVATEGRRCLLDGVVVCQRAALMQRVAPKVWEAVWVGRPVDDGGPDQVRGITSWTYADGRYSLWFVTTPRGTVFRIDAKAAARSAPRAEISLGELLPESCNARMLPYQLHVHQRAPADKGAEVLVASQTCGFTPRDSFARIFHRPVGRRGTWRVMNMPTLTDVGADRSNEASVRWIETSPFDRNDIYFGTTDMNNTPGSLSARVYELAARF